MDPSMDQTKTAPPPYEQHQPPYIAAGAMSQPQYQGQPYPAGHQVPGAAGQAYFTPLPHQPGPGYAPAPQPQYLYQAPPPTVVHVTSDPNMHHHHHATTTTIVVKQDINHCLHCFISLIFPPWIFVWIFLCLTH